MTISLAIRVDNSTMPAFPLAIGLWGRVVGVSEFNAHLPCSKIISGLDTTARLVQPA